MVTVADIIRAVDEPLDATQCGGRENCQDDQRCMTHDLWTTLNAQMYEYLTSVTLAELVDASGQRKRRPAAPRFSRCGGSVRSRGRARRATRWPRSPE